MFPQSSRNPSFEASTSNLAKASSPSGAKESSIPASVQSSVDSDVFADLGTDDLTARLSSVCLDTDACPAVSVSAHPADLASSSTIQISSQGGPMPSLEDVVVENKLSTSDQRLGPSDSNYSTSSWNSEAGQMKYDPLALRDNSCILPNAHHSSELSGSGLYNNPAVFNSLGVHNVKKAPSVNKEESSIISDILALDFDPWDGSSSIPNNLSAPWRCKNTGQSRFLFARHDGQGDFLEGPVRESESEHRLGLGSLNSYQNGLAYEGSNGSSSFVRSGPGFGSDRIAGLFSSS
jgi:hypothetical protein